MTLLILTANDMEAIISDGQRTGELNKAREGV